MAKILYVEELQSDWGQRGAGRGFKLEGKKLAAAKKNLKSIKEEMLDLKKGGVELNGFEQEEDIGEFADFLFGKIKMNYFHAEGPPTIH